ncbi:hypothetical protein BJV78DRAFT_1226023 [Lactifluus subvellereus]|nr:hypothetical protein BJV78DRAFT_1226023 [Lactifluus subvellereus]
MWSRYGWLMCLSCRVGAKLFFSLSTFMSCYAVFQLNHVWFIAATWALKNKLRHHQNRSDIESLRRHAGRHQARSSTQGHGGNRHRVRPQSTGQSPGHKGGRPRSKWHGHEAGRSLRAHWQVEGKGLRTRDRGTRRRHSLSGVKQMIIESVSKLTLQHGGGGRVPGRN